MLVAEKSTVAFTVLTSHSALTSHAMNTLGVVLCVIMVLMFVVLCVMKHLHASLASANNDAAEAAAAGATTVGMRSERAYW